MKMGDLVKRTMFFVCFVFCWHWWWRPKTERLMALEFFWRFAVHQDITDFLNNGSWWGVFVKRKESAERKNIKWLHSALPAKSKSLWVPKLIWKVNIYTPWYAVEIMPRVHGFILADTILYIVWDLGASGYLGYCMETISWFSSHLLKVVSANAVKLQTGFVDQDNPSDFSVSNDLIFIFRRTFP